MLVLVSISPYHHCMHRYMHAGIAMKCRIFCVSQSGCLRTILAVQGSSCTTCSVIICGEHDTLCILSIVFCSSTLVSIYYLKKKMKRKKEEEEEEYSASTRKQFLAKQCTTLKK